MEQSVQVGNRIRRFVTYVPARVRSSCAGVFILGPNGSTAEELLAHSGWREFADSCGEDGMVLFFLEPENGVWNTAEAYGDPAGDTAYVSAVFIKALERLFYCVHECKYYIYGEKEGGTVAHFASMNPPVCADAVAAIYSGIATLDAEDVPEGYRSACQSDACVNLMGFYNDGNVRLRKGEIPMPVWMIESKGGPAATGTLQYWKRANGTDDAPLLLPDGTEEYRRTAEPEYPANQDKRAYCVWHSRDTGLTERPAAELPKQIWKRFLYRQRRWMGDPGGDLRLTVAPVEDLGMERHTEVIQGWLREWYVYRPKRLASSAEPLPVVFALHGYSCSGEIYIGHSEWHRVADARGFIVVYPTALPGRLGFDSLVTSTENILLPAWNFMHNMPNGPDEFHFFRTLLDRVGADCPIDRSRVFVTGHSHGSMMSQALALGMPELFAAAAPCSGVILGPMYDSFVKLPELWKTDLPTPVWMFAGRREEWVIDADPAMENSTGKTLDIWHRRNALEGTAAEKFTSGWARHGRWSDLSYSRADGAPMLRYSTVDDFPHAIVPEMAFRIWDEFFSHWSREGEACVYS